MTAMKILACAALASLFAHAARADGRLDDEMKTLAAKSGCTACHQIASGAKGPNGGAPIGPNWEDVALRYKGQPGKADALVKTVMNGSNAYTSHWQDKVSGLAMPPNAVAIQQADAERLVHWILSLK